MFKRVALSYTPAAGWFVDLPAWDFVPKSCQPVTLDVIGADGVLGRDRAGAPVDQAFALSLKPSFAVVLPDDWPLDASGQIDAKRFRALYAGSRFGQPSYTPPALAEP